ncbi:MAG: transcription termination factor Rho [Solirubrobacteraceae bacterium]|nr:transcription termination factor Rho [Solirubrobacteraceae bacterium]
MAVLTRSALESSPLADLHEIASELGLDGFRRLRKADLVESILGRQDPDGLAAAEAEEAAAADQAEVTQDATDEREVVASSRSTRSRSRAKRVEPAEPAEEEPQAQAAETEDAEDDDAPKRTRRGGRGRGRRVRDSDPEENGSAPEASAPAPAPAPAQPAADATAEGVVDLLGNGSGFLRISPPEPSDGDVYISAAQVRRCELVDGDRVSGPVRAPRRSERYPSLVRVDTINDRPADEVAEGTPFDDLPAKLPDERFVLEGDDPTLRAIVDLTPFGRGSRVTIAGPAFAGKTEALRLLAFALNAVDGVEVSVVLAGVRPEELAGWKADGLEPAVSLSFSASPDARGQAVERAIDAARRQAARGSHGVVLIDTLDGLPGLIAQKALGAARAIVDGGSLTVIATASAPLGGETTVVVLDRGRTSVGLLPALDLGASATLRPELLVGERPARALEKARADARTDK